jgi:hypothetical protein
MTSTMISQPFLPFFSPFKIVFFFVTLMLLISTPTTKQIANQQKEGKKKKICAIKSREMDREEK